jgi:transcriptional regulator with XRE-family HTH domain
MTNAEQLEAWIEERGAKQTAIAAKIGVTKTAFNGWLRRGVIPQPVHRAAIETLTGIPAKEWVK